MIKLNKNTNIDFTLADYSIHYKDKYFLIYRKDIEARPEEFADSSKFNLIVDMLWVIVEVKGRDIICKTDISANQYFLEDAIEYAWKNSPNK